MPGAEQCVNSVDELGDIGQSNYEFMGAAALVDEMIKENERQKSEEVRLVIVVLFLYLF